MRRFRAGRSRSKRAVNDRPDIVPIKKLAGSTAGELLGQWWAQVLAIPEAENPLVQPDQGAARSSGNAARWPPQRRTDRSRRPARSKSDRRSSCRRRWVSAPAPSLRICRPRKSNARARQRSSRSRRSPRSSCPSMAGVGGHPRRTLPGHQPADVRRVPRRRGVRPAAGRRDVRRPPRRAHLCSPDCTRSHGSSS